jgi:hypothetical protein
MFAVVDLEPERGACLLDGAREREAGAVLVDGDVGVGDVAVDAVRGDLPGGLQPALFAVSGIGSGPSLASSDGGRPASSASIASLRARHDS